MTGDSSSGFLSAPCALGACLLGAVIFGSGCGAPDPEISVAMSDYGFTPDKINVERGKKTVLVLQNKGAVEHNLFLKQQNVGSPNVAPGQTVKFDVTLPPGTFSVICNLPEHEANGMVAQIISSRGR